jgi:hypothetical protein
MPLILPGNVASATASTTYTVDNSCRFDGTNDYMVRSATGNDTESNNKWTFSCWVKRAKLGAEQMILDHRGDGNQFNIRFMSDDSLYASDVVGGYLLSRDTNAVYRDTSAWMHILWSSDRSIASPTTKLWVNGTEVTSWATSTEYSQDDTAAANQDYDTWIGGENPSGSRLGAYLAEVVWLDGTFVSDATDFGEFDEDSPTIWKPKDVSGLTFGTNGFYFDFEDSANLGNDANGGTDFTETGLAAINQATDTPTNNFCTFNPLAPSAAALAAHANGFGEGNLQNGEQSPNYWQSLPSTFGVTSGKWYWEFKDELSWGDTSNDTRRYGICDLDTILHTRSDSTNVSFSDTTSAYAYMNSSGVRYNNGTISGTTSDHPTFEDDDIIMVALDLTNNKLYFGKNGTWNDSGDPTSGATGTGSVADISATATWSPYVETKYGSDNVSANFGNPIAAPSSGNADADGYGNFEYAPPSGYYALCTKNLGAYGG